ncbi:MAG: hypothetical protein PVF68_15165 [Acidobacteriota bacterium]|jgi:hypothetical protein
MRDCDFRVGQCILTESYGHGTIYEIDRFTSTDLIHLRLDSGARAAVEPTEARPCPDHPQIAAPQQKAAAAGGEPSQDRGDEEPLRRNR